MRTIEIVRRIEQALNEAYAQGVMASPKNVKGIK